VYRHEDLDAYFEKPEKIRPEEAHVCSTDRPVPNTEIKRVNGTED